MTAQFVAQQNEILRGLVGSTALGLGLGTDDRDEMGVCIEPPFYVCGLRRFEQWVYRSKPDGVRSEAGDLDLVVYSLRKFIKLAAKGNPSILILLWLPDYLIKTEAGSRLIDLRQEFVSQEAGKRFLGYLVSQKLALKGERTKKVSRPELVEKYGFDTKFAYHAVRLGLQGIEYLDEGKLQLPMQGDKKELLLGIRKGKYTLKEVLETIDEVESELIKVIDKCDFEVNYTRVNRFLVNEQLAHWAREFC